MNEDEKRDSALYELYKQVRNKIRRFHPLSIIKPAVDILHRLYVDDVTMYEHYQPWELLLLIRWVTTEADPTSHCRPPASTRDFRSLLAILHQIGDTAHDPKRYANIMLLMRQFAFQQFWLQGDATGDAIGRQYILFAELPTNHRFQTVFKTITGVSIADFLALSAGVLSLVLQNPSPRAIFLSNLTELECHLAPNATYYFFTFLSKSLPELRDWFNSENLRTIPIASQRLLPTPLLSFPFVNEQTHYAVYFPLLLIRSLESVVYRTLRQHNSQWFGDTFGSIFEDHVARCSNEAGLSPLRERELQRLLPGDGKCVDFVYEEENSLILVDAKAVEMASKGKIAETAKPLLSALSTALGAIDQGFDTQRRLLLLDHNHPLHPGSREVFLVVISYDHLYLGSNHYLRDMFGEDYVASLERKFSSPLPIPLSRIFFLSISEFEQLMARVREKKTSFLAALRYATEQDADHNTLKFTFQQHIDSHCSKGDSLPFMRKATGESFEWCIQKMTRKKLEENE